MGVENLTNITDIQIGLSDILPQEILGQIDKLIWVSKIAVYIFIGYIVFILIKQFYGWRRGRRINIMYHKINEIDEKLNLLLDIEKVKLKKERLDKEKKIEKSKKDEKNIKEKKKSFFDIFKKNKK